MIRIPEVSLFISPIAQAEPPAASGVRRNWVSGGPGLVLRVRLWFWGKYTMVAYELIVIYASVAARVMVPTCIGPFPLSREKTSPKTAGVPIFRCYPGARHRSDVW